MTKKVVAAIAGFLLVTLVVGAAMWQLTKPGRVSRALNSPPTAASADNPYAYAVDSLADVDSSRIGYREVRQVALGMHKPQAISAAPGGGYYATDGVHIERLDSAGKRTATTKIEGEPVTCLTIDDRGQLLGAGGKTVRVYADTLVQGRHWQVGSARTIIASLAAGDGYVFVADAGMKVVWRLDTAGRVEGKIGLKDTARGVPGLVVPSPYMDVALGRGGSVWVVNPGRHQLESYRPNGDPLSSWGETGARVEGFSGCCGPTQMALLSDGSFVTAEKGIVRVKVYDPAGQFVAVVAPHAAFNPKERNLDLAVDAQGRILVLDSHAKQIRIFEKKPS